jgi:PAS domain S-box-containing protein
MNKELRILIVEDVPSDLELLEGELRKAKIVFCSKNVDTKEAFLKELKDFAPDLILSDYSLPSFEGMSALKIAKQTCPDVPFIFVTGSLGEERAIETLKRGATDYVLKDKLSRLAPSVRRAAQEAEERIELRSAEQRILQQADLLNIATDAITVLDMEHHILFWNKGAEEIYGWGAQEAIGAKVNQLLFKNVPSEFEEALKVIEEKGEWKGEFHQLTRDGKEAIVESRWTLVRDEQGKPKSIFVVSTDITEKKKIEAQFLRAQRMESIGTLAGGIAHDLNNMLQPIMMSLQLLKVQFPDNKSHDLLEIVETSAKRGADLIRQVLSFAKGMEGEHAVLQVRHIISEIVRILKETFPKSIQIQTDVLKELWTISGDPTQLHQVLMNLCVNARDAMPSGGTLSITVKNLFIDENYAQMNIDARAGPYIAITVSDSGTGIPPKILERIFEPFFTTKEPGKGTGLGLSTSYGIVKGHGGFIHVYSEVGKGTRFKIYLPAFETAETKVLGDKKIKELPTGHGELILVIDDEPAIRDITSTTLQRYGYRAITANDGADGVALYVHNKVEIKAVIVDMVMPIMDGRATIRALRKIDPDVKIVAVSGLKDDEEHVQAARVDANTFLSKPYTAETLLKTLHELLRGEKIGL